MVANIDLAPTMLDIAGVSIPDSMQGKSFKPLLAGETPREWRNSVYYRYYHSPGHHNTQAHLGVRTATHKLIYYWNKSTYELYDLVKDPSEQNNLLFHDSSKNDTQLQEVFSQLKSEITRLQKEFRDDNQYASQADWPKGGVDGPFDKPTPLGKKTVREAIQLL